MSSEKPTRFVPREEVQHRLGIGKSTLRKLIKDGEFPEPIYIHTTHVVWLEKDVDDYIQRKLNEAGRQKP